MITFVFLVGFSVAAWKVIDRYFLADGMKLNTIAWEETYRERGQPVPVSGPREGFWGSRLGGKVPDQLLGWHEPEVYIPGLVSIDPRGFQKYVSPDRIRLRILILGGSVAFGAYASNIENTYFNVLGRALEAQGVPVEITVFASGGWKSIQELKALQRRPGGNKPDVILFINGLNDITNGATASHLTGEAFIGTDGAVKVPPRIRDYDQRVSLYQGNMNEAQKFATDSGIAMIVALQPSLAERSLRTRLESRLLKLSLTNHESLDAVRNSYEKMRKWLLLAEQDRLLHFIDCSTLFDRERETMFTDIWHFSDLGHRLLGNALAAKIARDFFSNHSMRQTGSCDSTSGAHQ